MYFFKELKRRNVFRVAVGYVVLSWLMAQAAELLLDAFGAPAWVLKSLLALFLIGFPFAVFFAWAFELTPEGLKREHEVDRSQSATRKTGRNLDRAIIVALLLALTWFAWDRFVPVAPEHDSTTRISEPAGTATEESALGIEIPAKSIAVLPFVNMSDDAANEYFSDGISEEILNLLAKLPGLHVTSRSSAFQFKGDDIDIPTVAKQLGVAHVLEGSVRKAGNRVRITVQLIDAGQDRHMWSETYDRELDDIFAIQDEIAAAVVGALQHALMGTVQATDLNLSRRTDTRAFELYLQARHQLWMRRPEPLAEAEGLFEKAIAIDPDYAPAYAGLAMTMVFQVNAGQVDPVTAYARAEAAINRALMLDAKSAEAHGALGLVRSYQGRNEEARAALRQAILLNPNAVRPYTWLSNMLLNADPLEALELAQQAYAMDPLARIVIDGLFWKLLRFGRSAEAMNLARTFVSLYPESGWGYHLASHVHASNGKIDQALMSLYSSYRMASDRVYDIDDTPFVMMHLGELDLAEAWAAEVYRLAPAHRWLMIQRADLAILQGRPEDGIELFTEAAERYVDPFFDHNLGFYYATVGDFDAALQAIRRGLPEQEPPSFDPDNWQQMIDFAWVLQATGAATSAAALLTQAEALINTQIQAGVGGANGQLQRELAKIHLLGGDRQAAVAALNAAEGGGMMCLYCLQIEGIYDGLRDEPGFADLLSRLETKLATQRQRLADEGMLLTPEQVLQLENFDYDPFVD